MMMIVRVLPTASFLLEEGELISYARFLLLNAELVMVRYEVLSRHVLACSRFSHHKLASHLPRLSLVTDGPWLGVINTNSYVDYGIGNN